MNFLYVLLVGGGLAILAWLSGNHSGRKTQKQKDAVQIENEKARASKAETERDLIQNTEEVQREHTAESDSIYRFFDEFEEEKKEADKTDNVEYAIEAAKKLAERAEAWRRRNTHEE